MIKDFKADLKRIYDRIIETNILDFAKKWIPRNRYIQFFIFLLLALGLFMKSDYVIIKEADLKELSIKSSLGLIHEIIDDANRVMWANKDFINTIEVYGINDVDVGFYQSVFLESKETLKSLKNSLSKEDFCRLLDNNTITDLYVISQRIEQRIDEMYLINPPEICKCYIRHIAEDQLLLVHMLRNEFELDIPEHVLESKEHLKGECIEGLVKSFQCNHFDLTFNLTSKNGKKYSLMKNK